MLFYQLIEAVTITRLEEDCYFAFLSSFLNQEFAKIAATEEVINEILKLIDRRETAGLLS
jgi:hypothetical protein